MIVGARFFLLLILGVIFEEGNCVLPDPYTEKFNKTVLRAICTLQCSDEPCITNCIQTQEIKELDEGARANLRLVCQDVHDIVLAHDPGLFVIETLPSNIDRSLGWEDPVVSDDTHVVMSPLYPKESYQFRLRRISASGISMPEITGEINTLTDDDDYLPMNATDIIIGQFVPRLEALLGSWEVKISFAPSEDRPCHYEVTCQQDNGPYNEITTLTRVEDFNVTYERLPFAANFTLTIKSLTNKLKWGHLKNVSGTIKTFSTPRCLNSQDSSYCLTKPVKGLNAMATHKTGNIFDIHVTWDKPDDDDSRPIYYIDIHPISGGTEDRVSKWSDGNSTHFVFQNVTIMDQYDVYIRRSNWLGDGPEISRRFTIGRKRTDTPENNHKAIYLAGTISIIVIGIGIAVYGYFKLRRQQLNQTVPVDEFEINPERLTITQVLGTGNFGVVKLGSLRDNLGNVINVAVKMLQDDSNVNDRRNFLHEIEIMKTIDEHPNIVCLLGCCTTSPYPFLVVEFCSRGDLQSFLRKSLVETSTTSEGWTKKPITYNIRSPRRKEILPANSRSLSMFRSGDDYIQVANSLEVQDTSSESEVVTAMDMLNFGRQIATGMEFLSSNRIVHRDLATRNVLVCHDRTVKISDFGLSRDIYHQNVYKKWGNGQMPLKWMAMESLTHQVYTTCSDVWSFGVLLWEIVTLGGEPYPGIPTLQILRQLQSGYRMERPANCSMPLYKVMRSCWQTRTKDRPTFTVLRQELDKLIFAATKNEYFDLNDVSEGTLPHVDNSQISVSRPTSCPLQVAIANDRESPINSEVPEGRTDQLEVN